MKLRQLQVFGLTLSLLCIYTARSHADVIYVNDTQNGQVTLVQTNGTLRPFATNISSLGMAVDADGTLYVSGSEEDIIRKVTPDGVMSDWVSDRSLGRPAGLTFDKYGFLYSASLTCSSITRVGPSGTLSPFASGICLSYALAFDASGNLYAGDMQNNLIVKITPMGQMTTFATHVDSPFGLAFDQSGLLYVSSVNSGVIYKISPAGAVSTFAQGIDNPTGIAFGSDGCLYVCSYESGQLLKISPSGQIQTFATGLEYPTAIAIARPLPPPTRLQMPDVTVTNSNVVVPITMVAQGNENAAIFSVSFNPNFLSLEGIEPGRSLMGGILVTNCTGSSNGNIGIGVSLPSGAVFPAGTQQIAAIYFRITSPDIGGNSPLTFCDTPAWRQVSDAQAFPVPATYVNGSVKVFAGWEGDVVPELADGKVTTTDWVRVGRLVAKLATPLSEGEFQRADCAPRDTLGDGQLTVADWVQAGRYAVGMDSPLAAGGPGNLQTNSTPTPHLIQASARTISIPNAKTRSGGNLQLPVQLNAQGNENSAGFTVTFDPSALQFTGARLGSGAQGAILNVNDFQSGAGVVGVALALPPGATFAKGTQEIVNLSFTCAATPTASTRVGFSGNTVVQQVVDINADALAAAYVPATVDLVSVKDIPPLSMVPSKSTLTLSWPLTDLPMIVESTDDLASTNWQPVAQTAITNLNSIVITVPKSEAQRFYRLRTP